MSASKTADEWVSDGESFVGASRWADSANDYHEDLASARDAFAHAIALEPGHRQAHLGRAEVLMKLGEFETAADAYVSVLQLTPAPTAQLLVAAARALSHAERAEAALSACAEALALAPADLEARVLRAELLSRLRRDEAAVEAWNVALADTALEKDWRVVRSKLERALALDRLAHPDAAHAFAAAFEAHFDKLTASPSATTFHTALQTSVLARREYSACLERLVHAANGWMRAGSAWLAAKRPDEALAAYQRALSVDPKSSRAWFGIAEAYAQAGELEQALTAYDESLKLEPGFLGALARRKVIEAELGQGVA
ncbi:MAG: tetratricopeptide repeat protein [Myxococcaceae bacterium]